MAAFLLPNLGSIWRAYQERFDQAAFDKEVARVFDSQDIVNAIDRYELRAETLCKDKESLLKLIQHLDLTTLSGDDTEDKVVALAKRALEPVPGSNITTGSICVYPQRVRNVKNYLRKTGKKLNITGVAGGFPSGQYHLQSKILEVELTVADGANEIDIVISRAAAIDQDWKTVYDEVLALKKACGSAHLKTILATGELKSWDNVYKASWASILAGSDFIKTSTGKETTNATLEVAHVMCHAIKRYYELTGKKVGFKPAGGIKTAQEAFAYIACVSEILGEDWVTPDLFRIGASSLLDDILKRL